MERGSAKHGPRVDDELEREEAPAEDDPDLGLPPIVEEPEPAPPEPALELRADLARFTRPRSFPATTEDLVHDATDLGAPPDILSLLLTLPRGRVYQNVEEVWADVGGEEFTHGV